MVFNYVMTRLADLIISALFDKSLFDTESLFDAMKKYKIKRKATVLLMEVTALIEIASLTKTEKDKSKDNEQCDNIE